MEGKTVNLSGQQIAHAIKQERTNLEMVQKTIASVQNLMQEIFFAKESLKSIKKTKKGEKAMLALGVGLYLDVKIDENSKVKKSIPGNIIIDSQIDKALEDLDKKEKEAQEKLEELDKQQKSIYANMNTLGQIVTQAEKARREQTN